MRSCSIAALLVILALLGIYGLRRAVPIGMGTESAYRGTIARSCAPFDGPAIQLRLIPVEGGGEEETLLTVWNGLPLQPGTGLQLGPSANNGSIVQRSGTEAWRSAASGGIYFEIYSEGQGARGRWWATFEDGSSLGGPFAATWENQGPVVCG